MTYYVQRAMFKLCSLTHFPLPLGFISEHSVVRRRKRHLGGNSFPDSVDQELVLVRTFWQINDCNKISVAKKQSTIITLT